MTVTNQMAKVVSNILRVTEVVLWQKSLSLFVSFFCCRSLDESFNPGEEDDDIAEE